MTKILVTGNAGSGKSTLANEISQLIDAPVFSMDGIVWKEGWQKTPRDEVLARTNELIRKKAWVIDGVSFEVMNAADQVVFLDLPRRVCYWRAAKRNCKYLFRSRPELPPHCPEISILPKLARIIWRFPNRVRPKLLQEKIRRGSSFVHITNEKGLRQYLASLASRPQDNGIDP